MSNNERENSMHAFQGFSKLFLVLIVYLGPFQVGQEVRGSILRMSALYSRTKVYIDYFSRKNRDFVVTFCKNSLDNLAGDL